jgi:hypothetical protein
MRQITSAPVCQRALDNLLKALPAGDVFVLKCAAPAARVTVLRALQAAAGGVLLGVRGEFAAPNPLPIEDVFLGSLERALASHALVIADGLHFVVKAVGRGGIGSHLLDAGLTALMGDAAAWGKKLVFGVGDEAPWPVRRRAHVFEIRHLPVSAPACCTSPRERKLEAAGVGARSFR